MFASFPSLLAGPLRAEFFGRHVRVSPVERDFEALLTRLRQRLYPETIPVLASYWLKTIYASGYELRWWQELNGLLKRALGDQLPNDFWRQAIIEVQAWIQQTVLLTAQKPRSVPLRLDPARSGLNSERLAVYIGRLLNEWLPVEVARLLVSDSEFTIPQVGGIPVLAIGRGLERLLVRERLSPATLGLLLEPELLSPQWVYPADAEILGDVVLSLLGRTSAPIRSVMPATLLCVAPGSLLPSDYREAVRHAVLVPGPGGEEVHVPIAAVQALQILNGGQVRIGSIVVTMDGRWWESENLQSGEQHSVVYRPKGRLRIDYSADHAKLRIPWPEIRLQWSGGVSFRDTFEIFGREWHVSQWEVDAERAWLHLVFSRTLPMAEIAPAEGRRFRRSRPASADMAWATLENALASSILEKSSEPIERLRHSDLIPLGRAISELTEAILNGRLQKRETIETHLKAIRYLEAQVSPEYGRVPWRILPAPVRAKFLKGWPYPTTLLELLNQVFDALPGALRGATSRSEASGQAAGSTSPPQAA